MSERGFKAKTIARTIDLKIKGWLNSITDEELRARVAQDVLVTGGAIASMLQGELPNDYDIYLRTPETAQALANYYLKGYIKNEFSSRIEAVIEEDRVRIIIKSAGVIFGDDQKALSGYTYFESAPQEALKEYLAEKTGGKKAAYTVQYITSNAITLSDGVQICLRFTGSPEQIHENYDFVHCTNVWSPSGLKLRKEALEAILTKELRYIGSKYPICSLFRIKKFIQRGWTITAGEVLKIAWDVSELNLADFDILQEQLVGVDQAYFTQILSELKNKGDVDRTYLFEIINRIFDDPEIIPDQPQSSEE